MIVGHHKQGSSAWHSCQLFSCSLRQGFLSRGLLSAAQSFRQVTSRRCREGLLRVCQGAGVWVLIGALTACDSARVTESALSDVTELTGMTAWSGAPQPRYPLDPLPLLSGGIALLDIDRDGDLDVFLVQVRNPLAGQEVDSAEVVHADQLWLNESTSSRIRLIDSSGAFGLPDTPLRGGTGAAVGDANGDGYPDIWVTTMEQDRLLLNQQGQSVQITEPANTEGWGASAVWFDANQDGRDDVFVTRVVKANSEPRECRNSTSLPDYCALDQFVALHDQMLINQGVSNDNSSEQTRTGERGEQDLNLLPTIRFRDVSDAWGFSSRAAVSLSTAVLDANSDGYQDIYVATYGAMNQLWLNQSGRGMREVATNAGAASEWLGQERNSTGVVIDDVDDDGDQDVWVTQSDGQQHTLLVNQGINGFLPQFVDGSMLAGIAAHSRGAGGAGAVAVDVNGDGRRDLYVANGAFTRQQKWVDRGAEITTQQQNSLWLNQAPAQQSAVRYTYSSSDSSGLSPRIFTSRGVARGDLDNDGDADLVVSNYQGPVQVYRNTLDPARWLGVVPRALPTALAATGATAWLVSPAAGQRQTVQRSMGMLSSSDPRLLFYPPTIRTSFTVRVRWVDGQLEDFELTGINRYHEVIRGLGETIDEGVR